MGKRKVTQYTEEFKRSSAKMAATDGESVSKIARDLGINVSTLTGWVKKYYGAINNREEAVALKEALEELKRLKKENSRLTQERDILKKATAYFARGT